MKVLVTGAGGQLGCDVAAAINAANHQLMACTKLQLDITEAEAVSNLVQSELPDAVINCAAYADVDGAEDSQAAAYAINAEGVANLADATAQAGAKLIHISTDYVFDGDKETPYVESDTPNPLGVYGQSKLAGEHEVVDRNPKYFIVRSSGLFGLHGRNFVETMLSLAQDSGEVIVVKDQISCPTYTGHLAQALVRLVDSTSFGIHHIAGWGQCSWYEFALEIFSQAGVKCRVMAGTAEMLARKARRPKYSALYSEREHPIQLPDWHEGLADFLRSYAVETV